MTDAASAVKNNNTRASQPHEKDPVPLLPGSLMWKDFGSYLFHLMLPQAFILQSAHPVIKGYRRSVCGVDSIYYRLNGGTVEIMRVLGRQDIDKNL